MQIFLKLFIRDYEKAKTALRVNLINGDPQYVHTWNSIDFLSQSIDSYPREVLKVWAEVGENFDMESFETHAKDLSQILGCLVETSNGFYKNGEFTGKALEFSPCDILAAVVDFRKINLQFCIDKHCNG